MVDVIGSDNKKAESVRCCKTKTGKSAVNTHAVQDERKKMPSILKSSLNGVVKRINVPCDSPRILFARCARSSARHTAASSYWFWWIGVIDGARGGGKAKGQGIGTFQNTPVHVCGCDHHTIRCVCLQTCVIGGKRTHLVEGVEVKAHAAGKEDGVL